MPVTARNRRVSLIIMSLGSVEQKGDALLRGMAEKPLTGSFGL